MAISTFSNTNFISIPEGGASDPYPSIINVSGISGSLTKLTVTLTNLNHTWTNDIDVLLVSPTGAKIILMSDVGGSNDLTNVTLTFDATATFTLPDSDFISSGTYQPTNFDDFDFFDSPAPDGPYNTDLSVFNGTNPNGEWRLYIVDDVFGDSGDVADGWSLSIETETGIITGDDSDNTLIGNILDNTLIGNAGNDTLTGSAGNDILNGGVGNDTADYSQIGQSITLSPTGIITKGGGLGNDQLIQVETIIADASAVNNTIDVSTAGNAASINVNLQTEQLTVNGVPGVGTFTVTNFDNVQGTSQNDTIIGNTQNNQLSGNAGNDTLNGGAGNDTLNGGAGTDALIGGLGNDIYIVDSTTDTITENASGGTGGGTDTIQSSVTYSIAAKTNIENLTLTGTTAINGTGNTGNNIIRGNNGNNTLNGAVGNDMLYGDSADYGESTLFNYNGHTYLLTTTGTWQEAQAQAQSLGGNLVTVNNQGEQDWLVTTFGGSERLWIGFTDEVTEGQFKWVNGETSTYTNWFPGEPNDYGNEDYVEINFGGAGKWNDLSSTSSLRGIVEIVRGNDTLNGGAGNDILDGGGGIDALIGGTGNDIYIVDSITDIIAENANEGTDTIQSSVTYSIAANIENLTLTGTVAINGTGNAANNVITGNAGNNILDGGAGRDTLIGGLGNDTYIVDTTTDTITENTGGGTDTIQSSVAFTIATLTNIENLTLTGTTAINGTGNAANNVITGNTANNILDGGAGTDTLIGGTGNDIYIVDSTTDTITENASGGTDTIQSSVTYTILAANVENLTLTGTTAINGTGNAANNVITGNSANNTLTGGLGKDTLTGGLGVDRFDYRSLADSVFSNFDVITDFNANIGNDLFLVATARTGFSNAGSVATLDTTQIAAKLTTATFTANAAAQFSLGSRTFVAINNATAGFSATTDAIIEVTGLTGTLGLNNFTTTLA